MESRDATETDAKSAQEDRQLDTHQDSGNPGQLEDEVASAECEQPEELPAESELTTWDPFATDWSDETSSEQEVPSSQLDAASQPFEGRWARLVSTTNWEKGQIIYEWRAALKEAKAPATEYSDEAWARRVGGVTGQHIGRLRRVYDRFGSSHDQYEGLFWSHFQAAIDWEDAEMWLEGCIQNGWSVSKMRKARWEAIGAPDDLKPKDSDIIVGEINEDLDVREDQPLDHSSVSNIEVPPNYDGPDFGDEDDDSAEYAQSDDDGAHIYSEDQQPAPFVRPFANIPDLPEDVGEAFEAFKLCIIRHRTEEWQEISREDMLSALESLKELTLAPAASDASF